MGYADKNKQRECHKRYYEANKEKVLKQVKAKSKQYKAAGKQFLYDYLSQNPCVDCGEPDPIVLEFDHVKGEKVGDIKRMVESYSIQSLKLEIEKCEVRCANCHRRVTHKRRKEKMEADKQTGDKIQPVEALR